MPVSARDRKRKQRAREKEARRLQENRDILEVTKPDLIDTRDWTWQEWMVKFQPGKRLLIHQIINLVAMVLYRMGIIKDPRQHGKTNYVLKPKILRRLCETVFTGPVSIIYSSHSKANSIFMTMRLREELTQNPAILKNYGLLIDYETHKQSRLKKQTQNIINFKNQKIGSHTFQGISTGQGIRGTSGIDETYIDDPIDLEKEEEYEKATKKFLDWLKFKIMPFCRGGKIWLIGTRYGVRDLYTYLDEEKLYYTIERAAVDKIYPYVVDYPEDGPLTAKDLVIENEEQWQLLAPELWQDAYNGSMVQNIVFEMVKLGERATQQELMNNPLPFNPLLQYEWFREYELLPTNATWAIIVDVAAGESQHADYTSMVLLGVKENNFYIRDIIYGKWTGKEKQTRLEEFHEQGLDKLGLPFGSPPIRIFIETVMGQRDFYQRIRDESYLTPKPIAPTRKKQERIAYGLGQEAENGKVFLHVDCRNKRQLKIELDSFPRSNDDHILDAADQGIYNLKTLSYMPRSGRTSSQFTDPYKM